MKNLGPVTDNKDIATKEYADALPVASHTHGSISDDGAIGLIANLPIFSATDGVLGAIAILKALALMGIGRGTCATSAGTAAKVVDLDNYALNTNGIVVVSFTNANTASNPTMNIEGAGAKAIYYKGAAILPHMLTSGVNHIFIYNGTQYELINPSTLYISGLSLPTSGWTGTGPYSKTFTVTGAVTDVGKRYLVAPVFSDTDATRDLEQTAWNLVVYYKVTSANTLTIKVSAVPATAVSFIFWEV